LPPKLSQMMINLSRTDEKYDISNIYDPFVWLGTILIEWAYMWIKDLFWSDFNPKMIQESKSNLWNLKSKFSELKIEIIESDARDTNENNILKNNKIDSIVTEWFLWEIMTQKNITIDRINIQKNNLSKLYDKFFSGLQSVWFDWIIVISFPFWDVKWKYVFLEEIYEVLNNYCEILPIFPSEFDFKETKSWSLLYKRQKQLVWREIFKLKIK
jgi:tRNA G10  N-methylase Trm11